MPTITTLATGLAGAIGSHYHGTSNRLYFVEYGGKLSRFDFVRAPDVVLLNNVSRTLKGTWLMNLDTGVLTSAGGDVWWEQIDAVQRRMVPSNGAQIAYLGVMTTLQFALLGTAELQALPYGSTPIVGDNNASNLLVPGAVFAVRTDAGNYAKVRVTSYGYNLSIRITTYRLKPAYQVLGTGYSEPEDVKVSADASTAYITERGGRLLRVALNTAIAPNRSAASVITSALNAPHQIALREDAGCAYVVEYATPGRLVRVDLGTGATTNIAFNLENAIGLVVTDDHQNAFISEQSASGGRVRRVDLSSGVLSPVASGFTAPFMMTFNNASESAILIAERDPANRVSLIDLGSLPVTSYAVASGVAARPSSVALLSGTRLVVCSDSVLSSVDLTSSVLTGSGPLLLGFGHVPVDRIVGGFADTSADPSYFFQVKDSPFGGTLALMFNHERARLAGAAYYKVLIDGAEVAAPWGDYKWSTATNRFEYLAIVPDAGHFYPVRQAGALWYNAWLGLARDTGDLADGLHQYEVRIYRPDKTQIPVPAGVITSQQLMIDNGVPTAAIPTIFHDGVPIGTCGIVTTGPDVFSFEIVANDPQQHLLSWSLTALWGDNRSAVIASDSYAAHVSPSKLWGGISGTVPSPSWAATFAGDPTSSHCAHTFILGVWDRVIDGYSYIHYAQVSKSITIMLP
jgi:hypothetical protein